MKRNIGQRVSSVQKTMLVNYMQYNLDLAHNRVNGKNSHEKKYERWFILSEKLNALDGAIKTTEQWKKCWSDLKLCTRDKAAKQERINEKTALGRLLKKDVNWTDVDENIMSILNSYDNPNDEIKIENLPEDTLDLSIIETESSISIPSNSTVKKRKTTNTRQFKTSQNYKNDFKLENLQSSQSTIRKSNKKELILEDLKSKLKTSQCYNIDLTLENLESSHSTTRSNETVKELTSKDLKTTGNYNNDLTLEDLLESNKKLIELNEKIIIVNLEKNEILKKQNKLIKQRNKIEEEKLKLLKRKSNSEEQSADVDYIE